MRNQPGFRNRAWLGSAGRDPGVVKTFKGAAAKSSHNLAIHLGDGNAAPYTTADSNPLRGGEALSSRRKDCAPRRSTADFGMNDQVDARRTRNGHPFPPRQQWRWAAPSRMSGEIDNEIKAAILELQ